MIELVVPAAEPETLYWGMPLPAMLAMISLASVVLGAIVSQLVKKFRTPADNREDRVVVLDASDRLLQRFEKALADSDAKHGREIAALAAEVDDLKREVETMRRERFSLVTALERIAAIARKYGGEEAEREIYLVELPPGVSVRR